MKTIPTSVDLLNAEAWKELWPFLTQKEKDDITRLISPFLPIWEPHPDNEPQQMAYASTADVLGYGGAAGGGKTDLMCGSMLTKHQKSLVLRREATQLTGIIDRITEIVGSRDGFNGQDKIWRFRNVGSDIPFRQIEFGSTPNPDDWNKYQGRPRDGLMVDEAANFLEMQIRMLLGWVRSVDPKQLCQAILAFNPPTTVEGQWIIPFFGPWLDRKHPNPAAPGELRYVASIADRQGNSRDIWVPDGKPFVLSKKGEPLYDFDPDEYDKTDIIVPKTRTFIHARVTDNPYLMGTGYMHQLQALPEPLRSQMLKGDFAAGMGDDPWQLFPTAWVEAAFKRWSDLPQEPPMDSLGVDVARGGKDKTVLQPRYVGLRFGPQALFDGSETPNGRIVAGHVATMWRDNAPIHIDVIGVGSSPYDILSENYPVYGINVAEAAEGTDRSGKLRFFNKRSELCWKLRERLDPNNNSGIAIYPDEQLKRELCSIKWSVQGMVIRAASRDEIYDELKRSIDRAFALILANIDTPKLEDLDGTRDDAAHGYYDPYENIV